MNSLEGTCSCGRNHYVITLPNNASEEAQVFFDRHDANHRRALASPLSAFLRVPLTWFQSSTIAYYPDETHQSIRRVFSPLNAPQSKRVFCGFCGTQISYWTEEPAEEANFMNITLGSLSNDDLEALDELGLLDERASQHERLEQHEKHEESKGLVEIATAEPFSTVTRRHGQHGGLAWFEEMIDGSQLGRKRIKQRGHGTNADGSITVEWEISEYTEEARDVETPSYSAGSKRRVSQTETGLDDRTIS